MNSLPLKIVSVRISKDAEYSASGVLFWAIEVRPTGSIWRWYTNMHTEYAYRCRQL